MHAIPHGLQLNLTTNENLISNELHESSIETNPGKPRATSFSSALPGRGELAFDRSLVQPVRTSPDMFGDCILRGGAENASATAASVALIDSKPRILGMKMSTIIRSNVACSRAASPFVPPSAIEIPNPYRLSQARMAKQICGSSSTTRCGA